MTRTAKLGLWWLPPTAVLAVLTQFIPIASAVAVLLLVLGLLGMAVTGLVLGIASLLKAAGARKRPVSGWPMLIPLAVGIAGAIALGTGFITGPPPVPSTDLPPAEQLARIHRLDQEDRITLRFLRPGRDSLRLARVRDLLSAGNVVSPSDQLNAAMVLHHGLDSSDYRVAYELARAAFDSGIDTDEWPRDLVDWVWKAAYDRWMESIGKPQVHGTQRTITPGR